MDIHKAQVLKPGAVVHCPGDRGDAPFTGTVVGVGAHVNVANGKSFVWVEVQHPYPSNRKSVWPSNRLG